MLPIKWRYQISLSVILLTGYSVHAAVTHILTFFILPYPALLSKKVKQPHSNPLITPQLVNSFLTTSYPFSTAGIIATYGGYMAISDLHGQIAFPLMQQRPEFTILVTPAIQPVFMLGSTIHHWELIPTVPAKNYSITRKQNEKTKLYYWEVQESVPPAKNIIPLNSIVILARPKQIIVPLGITITSGDPQLVLPQIYATHSLNRVTASLHALKIKNFFSSIKRAYKTLNETSYATQIITRSIK